jgi:AraC-like DNA-binding protein
LLEKGHDQIAQIAYDTGFTSPSYFTKCFRDVYGLTPSEYAEKKVIR